MEPIHKSDTLKARPTAFQDNLVSCAEAAARWLARSIEACDGSGSAGFYSRFYHPFKGWYWSYPETTGYIIPTLLNYAVFASQPEYTDIAIKQADWILSLQFDNGALPGGVVIRGHRAGPSIFNTGQMILGLVAAADYTYQEKYLSSAFRAASWLANQVDELEGIWKNCAYVPGFSPAYYTRVCWPMLEVCSRKTDDKIKAAAVRVLEVILGWQQENGAIKNWGFQPDRPAFTHTIAYTLEGFIESGCLLGPEGNRFIQATIKTADVLRRRMEYRGRLGGAYDLQFKGRYWYTCLTGNCQMALVWMKIYNILSDARYISAALKALQHVMQCQRIRSFNPNLRGAVAGSSPLWGRYMTFRYPNWAAKFYLDAVMSAHKILQQLLEKNPCELWSHPDTIKASMQ